jgi:raffinose/stachyose/melibiose transport system substrate-binding protein
MSRITATPAAAKRVRRGIRATVGVVGASLLLAACSGTGGDGSGSGGALHIWYSLPTSGSSAEAAEIYKKYNIDPFLAENPDIQVNAVPNNVDTIDQKIQVALAAGNGPDIIPTPGSSNAMPYAAAGYLADLTDVAKENGWEDRLLPWALDMGYVDGKLQAVPTSYETLVVYYNKTLFDENGWSAPTDRASLEKLAAEMQAKGIIPFAAGNASYQPATEWLVSAFLNEVAGPKKLHDALAGDLPWTDPAIVSSIELLKQYFDDGYFGGGVKQYFSTQDPQKYAALADGKAGMYISGSWETFSLPEYFGANGNESEWAWAPLPPLADGVPSDVYPLAVGGTISVNAKASDVEAGKAYLEWRFSDTKTMWEAAEATGSQPLPIKFTEADVPSGIDDRYAAQYLAINDASESGKVGYVTWTSFGPKAMSYIVEHIDKVLNDNLSVDDFTVGIQEAYDADEKSGLIPPLFETAG